MIRVVVTGLGVVSPYGLGRRAFWAGLAGGRCAIGPITLFETDGFRARIAAEVPADTVVPRVSRRRSRAWATSLSHTRFERNVHGHLLRTSESAAGADGGRSFIQMACVRATVEPSRLAASA